MENNIRFRNHFSMVFQYLARFIWLMCLAFISAFLNDGWTASIALGAGAIVFLLYTILLWANTWITVGEQSIIIERNMFLSRRKNTIGLASVSNVNLEQGLIAMLFGTCKVKLDTNSLSTADSTDVTIILKKKDAENLRALLMERISDEVQAAEPERKKQSRGIGVTTTDVILHGIFGSRFLYTTFVPLLILLELFSSLDTADMDFLIEEVGNFAAETVGLGILVLIALVAWGILTAVFGLARSVIRYWDFRIERKYDKLILEYGLTKKVNYSIPVDKIQAVLLKQTFLARLCKRYMVEVINVGMNDDEKEAQAFLLPYSKKELLEERLHQLLPEFAECINMKPERQPGAVWAVFAWQSFLYLLFGGLVIAGMVAGVSAKEPIALWIAGGVIALIWLIVLLAKTAGYMTKGTQFGEQILLLVTGGFARTYVFLKYDKIQYVHLRQNVVAKRLGIQRGVAFVLASMQNASQEIPYFKEEKIEQLKMRL